MIKAAILSLVLSTAGVGSASAGKCGKLCDIEWWETATQEEVAAEIATADVNARDEYGGGSPLDWAARLGTPANITALLKAGANVNARDDDGETPLHDAAAFGASVNVKALLDEGADGRAKSNSGQTPFDYAEYNEDLKGSDAYRALQGAQYD